MPTGNPTYVRRLGLFDATMIVVGGIIGAGIFMNPAVVVQRAGTAPATLVAWVVGGIVAMLGALCFAELGARRPEAGGGYVYLRETFGPLPGFLYGWAFLFVINAGSIATVAVAFAHYTSALFGWPASLTPWLAAGAIIVLAAVNYVGVKSGAVTQNIFTVLKLLALAALIVAGLVLVPHVAVGGSTVTGGLKAAPTGLGSVARALGLALIPVLFSYGGWAHSNNIAGEIVRPERNLPRALLYGVGLVIVVYVLASVAYLRVLGVEGLAASSAPASEAMQALVGPRGAAFMAAGVAASTFGILNVLVMSAPRVLQAMAADGLFFAWAARLTRYRTPGAAIAVQAGWAVVVTLSGTYAQLVDYTVFGDWTFYGVIAATLFVYRARDRAAGVVPATYRAPAFPAVLIAFLVMSAFAVVSGIVVNPLNACIGATLILSGIPIFLIWNRRRQPVIA